MLYKAGLIEAHLNRDSADMVYQERLAQSNWDNLMSMTTTINKLDEIDFTEESNNYSLFINGTYGSIADAERYFKYRQDYIVLETEKQQKELDIARNNKNHIYTGDTIPIMIQESKSANSFVPLEVEANFTTGIYLSDTASFGYFADINRSRRPSIYEKVELNQEKFLPNEINIVKSLSTSSTDSTIYFVLFFPHKNEAVLQGRLAKIYKQDGLAWQKDVQLSDIPEFLSYREDTNELVINYNQNSEGGETNRLVINKDGDTVE